VLPLAVPAGQEVQAIVPPVEYRPVLQTVQVLLVLAVPAV
jgi:hypothetical protein